MRGAGGVHGIAKRRSLCARTCEPNPTQNRPPVAPARPQPTLATAIGVGAKAIGTPVCNSIRSVAVPATANARNGSCLFSIATTPSYPSASITTAAAPTLLKSFSGSVANTRLDALPYPTSAAAIGPKSARPTQDSHPEPRCANLHDTDEE